MQPEKQTTLQAQIDKNLQMLKTTRDEIKVRAHLFGMDVKQAWKELEPQIEHAEKLARTATEASAAAIGGALQALITFKKRLQE